VNGTKASIAKLFLPLAVLTAVFWGATLVFAYTGPSSSPPDGNVPAPLNVGDIDQIKDGGVGLGALAVFGDVILSGVGRYLNFGLTPGEDGYGLRDNNGLLEFKNAGSSWQSFGGIIQQYVISNPGSFDTAIEQYLNENPPQGSSQSLSCTTAANNFGGTHGSATCPSGFTLTGGGGGCDNGPVRNSRTAGNGWELTCAESGSSNRVEAVCCRLQ